MTPRLTLIPGNGHAADRDDDAVIAAELRAMLVPPGGAGDLSALEGRIMTAVRQRPGDPTALLARWARPAMAAAAAAIAIAIATDYAVRQHERRMAVMHLIGVPSAAAAQSAMREDVRREATLQQLLEP